ncbi:MAG: hypothetical protein KOO65_07395, partial [Desulfobacterales bacterium]|nr:hypothetical protein [Desulfobacterales bacterium]
LLNNPDVKKAYLGA